MPGESRSGCESAVVGGRGPWEEAGGGVSFSPAPAFLREPAFAFSRRRGRAAVPERRREGVRAPAGRIPLALGRHHSSPWRPPSGPRWPLDYSSGLRATPCPPRWVPCAVHGERRPLAPTRAGAQTSTLGGPGPGAEEPPPLHPPPDQKLSVRRWRSAGDSGWAHMRRGPELCPSAKAFGDRS